MCVCGGVITHLSSRDRRTATSGGEPCLCCMHKVKIWTCSEKLSAISSAWFEALPAGFRLHHILERGGDRGRGGKGEGGRGQGRGSVMMC